MRWPRRRAGTGVALIATLGLFAPALAHAARDPTASERAAITEAAERADGGEGVTVRVSDIEVSNVGPWAVATVTLSFQSGAEQAQEGIFREADGRWVATEREMPIADQRDIGLADPAWVPYFQVYLYVCWFFGLAGLIDVLLQPPSAFRAIGRSKTKWALIELFGLPLTGIFTWALYAARVRPKLVAAGGRRPRKLLRFVSRFLGQLAQPTPGERPPKPPSEPESYGWSPPEPETPSTRTCPACGGERRVRCTACGGSGENGYGSELTRCTSCGGRGWDHCAMCGNTGAVPA